MAWKLLTLLVIVVLANLLVFGLVGTLGFPPTPVPTRTPHATFTPDRAQPRRYVSPTPTFTITPTPRPTPEVFTAPGPY